MLTLPNLPYNIQRSKTEIVSLRGINFSDNTQDGDLAACENLSTRRWPYITTREVRVKQTAYSGGTAITSWEKLVVVQGTDLLYDGKSVGKVTAGEKQFAVVNTKMVIWPDKKYLDIESLTLKDLGAKATGNGAKFTKNTMTVTGWPNLTTLFKVGDTVTLSGCTVQAGNNKDYTIKALTATVLTVSANAFTEATESAALTLERRIPDLDFICESENRLWGCSSNKARTIYESALGESLQLLHLRGPFHGRLRPGCWLRGGFHRLLPPFHLHFVLEGERPAQNAGQLPCRVQPLYQQYRGTAAGLSQELLLQVINDVLFYTPGIHGVYAYSGGRASLIIPPSSGTRTLPMPWAAMTATTITSLSWMGKKRRCWCTTPAWASGSRRTAPVPSALPASERMSIS